MTTYQVDVTVQGTTPPNGSKPVIGLTYFVKTDSPEDAKAKAVDCAKLTQLRHPRKYKNATFSVADENVKIF